ncbi:MAG: outer membrane protein assembly factor BamD [Candidatus Omnitrophica bacterium]|nr:outer membrane protein assembly factor BamD [Candidatus Omnitrophota bacterium]
MKKVFNPFFFFPVIAVFSISLFAFEDVSSAFWIFSPGDKSVVNPKYAVKDTPEEQFDWAMRFFNNQDFKRAAEEFVRLTEAYKDSDVAPEAQYYAGRSFEELGKYYFAFQNYQKTVEKYPFTNRLKEIVEREFNIAKIFQYKEAPRLMELELNDALMKAVEIYRKVVENRTFGEFADKALYNMAECYRRMLKYSEAMDAYNQLITDYPRSPLIDESKYQLAYTTYEASLDPDYDQLSTDKALEKFRTIAQTTPIPNIAQEADKAIGVLKERKADSLLKVAEFYEKQKKYKSAVVYYKEVSGTYPETSAAMVADQKVTELQQRTQN